MMRVIALSAPEIIILRKVLTTCLIAVFVAVAGLASSQSDSCSMPCSHRGRDMRDVKILGPGCKRCVATADMVKAEADRLGVPITIEKVTDYAAIAGYGIASTPGVVIDGKVVHAGGLPKVDEIAKWFA